ncbi:MAG: type II toxin-antitoxin system RelB/DinJ family antitoxin [Verrucomicrobia bacterium]|nr:type II toxin-antitoxin system RelB/DinJ family antitoxin [Verrucomicrobiota bacterium]
MTKQLTARMDRKLKAEAESVFSELGLTPTVAVSMFYAQVVKVRGLPFRPSEFPALEEYGATLADADAAEADALAEIAAERKAGRVVRFTGKLPR